MSSKGRVVAKRSAPPGTTTEQFHAHHRKRSCLRKKAMTKVMAEGMLASLNRKRRPTGCVYECRYCGYWHLSKQQPRRRE